MTRQKLHSVAIVLLFFSCERQRVEKPLAGQPTMNELMHRQADVSRQRMDQQEALVRRAHALTADEARVLLAKLKQNPQDWDLYLTLVRHYEYKVNVADLDALRLWYIEHQPAGVVLPGNINPQYDRGGYERGKALWLQHVKRARAPVAVYERAAMFLEGGDQPMAEEVLEAGKRAYPSDKRLVVDLGRHFAKVLGSRNGNEAQTLYARSVQARLAESKDALLLKATWQSLVTRGPEGIEAARALAPKVVAMAPDSDGAREVKLLMARFEQFQQERRLMQLPPDELARASASDRVVLLSGQMRMAWIQQKIDDAASKAQELMNLVNRDTQYGDAAFQANMILGKAALRRNGDRRTAVRYLMAAAATPGLSTFERERVQFEMNLPRALVDWGERTAVADFLDQIAAKSREAKQLHEWAADIRKGINPDLIPTFMPMGCSQDPC